MKSVIYETKGRAREFNELAINLFSGCGHKCVYCYGADITHTNRGRFFDYPVPRVSPADIGLSAEKWLTKHPGEMRPILLCFICDPYQPREKDTQLTREAIKILHEYGLKVTILTKAGYERVARDFDLLGPGDAFATTLTCMDAEESKSWEPGAALPLDRIQCLQMAHSMGLETWVSLEPVIYPEDSIELMKMTRHFVGHFKIGPLNYADRLPREYKEQVENINYFIFGWRIKGLMDILGVKYQLKKDLLKIMRYEPEED